MINPNEAAIQLVYLVAGIEPVLLTHRVTIRLNPDAPDHPMTASGSHIGMVDDLVPYAQVVAEYVEKMSKLHDFPGVFEYEVTEGLGAWMAKFPGGRWPTQAEFKAELERLGAEFFAQ